MPYMDEIAEDFDNLDQEFDDEQNPKYVATTEKGKTPRTNISEFVLTLQLTSFRIIFIFTFIISSPHFICASDDLPIPNPILI